MALLKAIWDVMNGNKLNTGTIIIIASLVIQKVLHVDSQGADQIVAQVMTGVGGVIALIGYIHKMVKANSPEPTPVNKQ